MAFENLKSTGIRYLLGKLKGYIDSTFLKKGDAVTSVNGIQPGDNGDVTITSVPLADNLKSSMNQTSDESFLFRTSGGSVSINTGDASLMKITGDMAYTVDKTATLTVNGDGITATLDEDEFFAAVISGSDSGTVTLNYTTAWSDTPADYGITVRGTPVNGDSISVAYNKGEITQSNPQTFVSTGWNLYNHANGYARVKKYSDDENEVFGISGAYTAIQFSTTLDGERSSIVPNNGKFSILADGYIWVTGGNNTTTEIWMTWKDWGAQANGGVFASYSEAVIDFSTIMETYFESGLLCAGDTRDEINLTTGKAYSRVGRYTFTAENLATVKALGTDYVYDADYIYYGKSSVDEYNISMTYVYKADDHGNEFFTGSDVPVGANIMYGTNLKNKLERDVLTRSSDVVDNLTSSNTSKTLSAKQGKVLKDLVDTKPSVIFKQPSFNSLNQASLDLDSNTRHLIIAASANSNTQGVFVVNVSNTGAVNALTVAKGSNITSVNTSTANKFRIIVDTVYTVRFYDILLGSNN